MSAGDRFFAVSNLLLYYVDPEDSQKRLRAMEWLNHLWMAGAGRLSWQVLHEFYWNAVRKMRLEPSKAREIVVLRAARQGRICLLISVALALELRSGLQPCGTPAGIRLV